MGVAEYYSRQRMPQRVSGADIDPFRGDVRRIQRNALTAALIAAYGEIKVHDEDTLTYLGVNIGRRNGAFHLDQRHLISLLDY